MDWKTKYIKYKNKYLDLKRTLINDNILTGGAVVFPPDIFAPAQIRRLNLEVQRLEKEGFLVDGSEIASRVLYVIDSTDGVRNRLELPEGYPQLGQIVLNGVKQFNLATDNIINIVKRIPNDRQYVLVYCHPKNIKNSSDHFLYGSIQKAIEESGLTDPTILTIDITIGDDGDLRHGIRPGPNIKANGFSDEFINRYTVISPFDIVFMPDCGGPWYELQNTPTTESIPRLLEIIERVMRIVKPGGKLIISKIFLPGLYEAVIERFPTASPFLLVENSQLPAIQIVK